MDHLDRPGDAGVLIVGGFANWRSYHAARCRGDGIAGWITLRYRGLMTPITAFLATWLVIAS